MPIRPNAQGRTNNQEMTLLEKAMSGDMVMVITPETVDVDTTTAAWDRTVTVSIQTAAGEVHSWLNSATETIISVTDDGGGTASCVPATTLTLVNGGASIVVSGTAATWADSETDTLTIANLTILGYTVTGGTSVETFNTPA